MSIQSKKTTAIGTFCGIILSASIALICNDNARRWGGKWFVAFLITLIIITFIVISIIIIDFYNPNWRNVYRLPIRIFRRAIGTERFHISLDNLAKSIVDLKQTHLETINRLDRVLKFLKVKNMWLFTLSEASANQQLVLTRLKNVISSLVSGARPEVEIDDADLSECIDYISYELGESDSPDLRKLIFEIRRESYGLAYDKYPTTQSTLRQTATKFILDTQSKYCKYMACIEIMAGAETWPYTDIKLFEPQLRLIRRNDEYLNYVREIGLSIENINGLVAHLDPSHFSKRLWKRVWSCHGNAWGRISCHMANGTVCSKNESIAELSLGGASCPCCDLSREAEIGSVEIDLPESPNMVSVIIDKAVLSYHDRFNNKGERVSPGMSIEFTAIESDSLLKLARFIKGRSELDRFSPPQSPPWQSQKTNIS